MFKIRIDLYLNLNTKGSIILEKRNKKALNKADWHHSKQNRFSRDEKQ